MGTMHLNKNIIALMLFNASVFDIQCACQRYIRQKMMYCDANTFCIWIMFVYALSIKTFVMCDCDSCNTIDDYCGYAVVEIIKQFFFFIYMSMIITGENTCGFSLGFAFRTRLPFGLTSIG